MIVSNNQELVKEQATAELCLRR